MLAKRHNTMSIPVLSGEFPQGAVHPSLGRRLSLCLVRNMKLYRFADYFASKEHRNIGYEKACAPPRSPTHGSARSNRHASIWRPRQAANEPGIPAEELEAGVGRWNELCSNRLDEDLGLSRNVSSPSTRRPIGRSPAGSYRRRQLERCRHTRKRPSGGYAGPLWKTTCTSGGGRERRACHE